METRTERRTGVGLSRRTLLAGTAAAAGASAISWKVIAEQIETLKKEGWEANPVACKVCGGGCGLIIMKKTGVKPSLATVRVFPNPTHPQRGMCGRASQAAMLWASPYRLKKPLKRVGARGEGKFKEVSWDEALDGIAKQLKPIVEKYRRVVRRLHEPHAFRHPEVGVLYARDDQSDRASGDLQHRGERRPDSRVR